MTTRDRGNTRRRNTTVLSMVVYGKSKTTPADNDTVVVRASGARDATMSARARGKIHFARPPPPPSPHPTPRHPTGAQLYDMGLHTVGLAYGGRPHPGKWNVYDAALMQRAYPDTFAAFGALRRRLDPTGKLSNTYLDDRLGAV